MKSKYSSLLIPLVLAGACTYDDSEPCDDDFRIAVATENARVNTGRGSFTYSPTNMPPLLNLYVQEIGELCIQRPDGLPYWPIFREYSHTNTPFGSEIKAKWPAPTVDLYAWSPNLQPPNAEQNLIDFNWNNDNGRNYVESISYVCPNSEAREDILWGSHYQAPRSSSPVPLVMKHLMAKITFSIRTHRNDLSINIYQLNLDHVFIGGLYKFKRGHTTAAGSDPGEWSLYKDNVTFVTNVGRMISRNTDNTGTQIIRNEAKTVVLQDEHYGGDYELLVMPQEPSEVRPGTTECVMLCPNVTVTHTETGQVLVAGWQRFAIPVDKPAGGWKQNTQYHYIITFDPEPQLDVEILPIDFSVNDFINGGTLTPPTN